jgi:predicted membrane protein
MYKTATVWMWYAPELIGWFAIALPSLAWHIIFSPLSARTSLAVTLICMLLTRVISENRKSS